MSDTVEILLSRGMVALVDPADAGLVLARNWYATAGGRTFYAVSAVSYRRGGVRRSPIAMHRLIVGASEGEVVDHIDGNGLNNKRANLRICCHAENIQNSGLRAVEKTSRFKGVSHDAACGRWRVEVERNGRRFYVGSFKDEEVAARRYDAAARLIFGSFARTNVDLGLLDPKPIDEARKASLSRAAAAILSRRA